MSAFNEKKGMEYFEEFKVISYNLTLCQVELE